MKSIAFRRKLRSPDGETDDFMPLRFEELSSCRTGGQGQLSPSNNDICQAIKLLSNCYMPVEHSLLCFLCEIETTCPAVNK